MKDSSKTKAQLIEELNALRERVAGLESESGPSEHGRSIQTSDAHQRLVLESLPMAFYVARPFGDFGGTWVSHQIHRIAGFSAADFEADTHLWSTRLHPDDKQRALDAFSALPKTEALEIEYRWQNANGEYVWVLDKAVLVRGEDGAPKEVVGTWVDVSDRKRAEGALKESEERYRTLFTHANDGIYLIDPESQQIVDCNAKASESVGYSYAELCGKKVMELHPKNEHARLPDTFREIGEKRSVSGIAGFHHLRKDGTIMPIEINATVLEVGGKVRNLSIVRDVTERVMAEERLRITVKDLRRLEAIVNRSPAMVFLWPVKEGWPVEYVSNNVEQILGYPPADFLFGRVSWTGITHPDDRERLEAEVAKYLAEGAMEFSQEYRLVTKSGEERWMRDRNKVLTDGNGSPTHIQSIVVDVTERKRAEEALQENEAKLSSILRAAPIGIGLVSNRKILQVNELACQMVGRSLSELEGKNARILYPSDEEYEYVGKEKYRQIAATGEGTLETRWKHKDGSEIDVLMSSVPLDPSDLTVGVTFTALDITARKNAERALRESEERYRAYIQNAPTGIFVLDRQGAFIEVNDLACDFSGYSRQEMLRMSPTDLFSPDDPEPGIEHLQRLLAEGRSSGETPVRCKDGSSAWFAVHAVKMSDGSFLGFCVDVTERTRAEHALRQSEERLRKVYDTAPLAFVLWGRDTRVTGWNQEAERLFGWTREEAVGRDFFDFLIPEKNRPEVQDVVCDLLDDTLPTHAISENLTKDGRTITCDWNTSILHGHDGSAIGAMSLALDITEKKRAEEERLRLEAQVQQAQKLESLGVLAGGIAHDFNNLLMGVLGNADLALMELSPDAKARKSVERICSAARRASDLAHQMLAYSGKGRFVVKPVDLSEVIQEMSHLLASSISKDALVQYHLAEELPAVDGDITQLRQVVLNLITNASEALDEEAGIIDVDTGIVECDNQFFASVRLGGECLEGRYVYVEVSDTGKGMDEKTVEKVFDPFFTTKFTGRGLGLAVVLGIVRGHNGAITVESTVNEGTTMRVLFPALDKPAETQAEIENDVARPAMSGTILLVDDEPAVVDVGTRMLERAGFTVISAADGRDAVDTFREHHEELDCVVLDLTMPHVSGEDAFDEMRRIRDDIPVLLSSGYYKGEVEHRLADKGFAGFLQKPYEWKDLEARIREVLGD